MIEAYLDLALSSLLNLKNLQWKNGSDIFNLCICGGSLLIVGLFPCYVVWFIFRWGEWISFKKGRISQKYGAIFEGLDDRRKASLWYIPLFTLRRLLFILSIL